MDEILNESYIEILNEASVYIRRPSSNVEMTTLSDSPLLFLFVCLFFSVIMIKKPIFCLFRENFLDILHCDNKMIVCYALPSR